VKLGIRVHENNFDILIEASNCESNLSVWVDISVFKIDSCFIKIGDKDEIVCEQVQKCSLVSISVLQ
jgi:hypothetical protein